jgi:PAS domain S-box-containing protein
VEDESIEAMNFENILNSFGFKIVGIASTGEEALNMVSETEPDLVLIDIVLKGPMDGIEVATHIKENFDIPVIYLTAHPEQSAIDRAKTTTPYGYLIKPVSKTDLRTTIELALYKHQIEVGLRESEDKYRSLFENANDSIIIRSKESVILDANPAACDMLGYNYQELVGKSLKTLISPDCIKFLPVIKEKLEKHNHYDYGITFLHSSGLEINAEASCRKMKYINHDDILCIIRDITNRKEIEDELRRTNEWLSFTQKSSKSGFWDWDIKTGKLTWSPEFYELFSLPPDKEPSFDIWLDILHPDDRDPAMEKIKRSIENHEFLINQYRVILPDGEVIWVRALGTTYYDENDRPQRMSGICLDITKIKEEEEKHKKIELQYQSLFDNMLNGFAYCKMIYKDNKPSDFIYISVNKTFESLTGLKDVEGKKVSEIIPDIQETDKNLFELYGRVASTGNPETFEIYIESLKECFSVSAYSPKKNYFVAIFDVITQRKKTELDLIESEKRFRMLFELSNAIMLLVDPDTGNIIDANPAAGSFYGYPLGTLKKMNIHEINQLPPDEIVELRKQIKNEEIKYLTAPHKIANGDVKTVELFSSPIKFKEGVLLFSIINDITKRIEAEERTKSSLEEKELLLKEIHHRVKNNLQIISSLLDLQEDYVKEDPTAVNVLKESQNRVLSMAMIHEMLYQSKDLNSINLSDYIRNLISNLFDSYGKKAMNLVTNLDKICLNIETAVPLGLIISELVSNSLKYAYKDDEEGIIRVELHPQEEKYKLIIEDYGKGIPPNIDFDHNSTLGLRLVKSLVNQLDGTIDLNRAKGSDYTIIFQELDYVKRI